MKKEIRKHPKLPVFFVNSEKLITISENTIHVRKLTGAELKNYQVRAKNWHLVDKETYINYFLIKLF